MCLLRATLPKRQPALLRCKHLSPVTRVSPHNLVLCNRDEQHTSDPQPLCQPPCWGPSRLVYDKCKQAGLTFLPWLWGCRLLAAGYGRWQTW